MSKGKSYDEIIKIKSEGAYDLAKIRVGRQALIFENGGWNGGQYEKIKFTKKTNKSWGTERVFLEVSATELKVIDNGMETKTCDLGHEHQVKKESVRSFRMAEIHVPWEHVETFIEWLQTGSWKQIRERRND